MIEAIKAMTCACCQVAKALESNDLADALKKAWAPRIEVFLQDMFNFGFDFEAGTYNEKAIAAIVERHQESLTDHFIAETEDIVEEYAGRFYDRGLAQFLEDMGYAKSAKAHVQKDIYDDLAEVTGSTRANCMRTVKRWHRKTQGKYFDRFIQIEIERVKSKLDSGELTRATLNKIGRDYKTFCEANGYWNSVSGFNAQTAEVFASVDSMYETNVTHYRIEAVVDKLTCDACIHMNGTEFSISKAMEIKADLLVRGSDELAEAYPFPSRHTIAEQYPDPADSPYAIPPFHPSCRCRLVPTRYESFREPKPEVPVAPPPIPDIPVPNVTVTPTPPPLPSPIPLDEEPR